MSHRCMRTERDAADSGVLRALPALRLQISACKTSAAAQAATATETTRRLTRWLSIDFQGHHAFCVRRFDPLRSRRTAFCLRRYYTDLCLRFQGVTCHQDPLWVCRCKLDHRRARRSLVSWPLAVHGASAMSAKSDPGSLISIVCATASLFVSLLTFCR